MRNKYRIYVMIVKMFYDLVDFVIINQHAFPGDTVYGDQIDLIFCDNSFIFLKISSLQLCLKLISSCWRYTNYTFSKIIHNKSPMVRLSTQFLEAMYFLTRRGFRQQTWPPAKLSLHRTGRHSFDNSIIKNEINNQRR